MLQTTILPWFPKPVTTLRSGETQRPPTFRDSRLTLPGARFQHTLDFVFRAQPQEAFRAPCGEFCCC